MDCRGIGLFIDHDGLAVFTDDCRGITAIYRWTAEA